MTGLTRIWRCPFRRPCEKFTSHERSLVSAVARVGGGELDDELTKVFGSLDLDTRDNGFRMFLGYRLDPRLSLEATCMDLRKFSFEGTFGGSPANGIEEVDG